MFTYASKTYVLRKPHIYYNMKALLQDIACVMYTTLYMQKSTISNNNTIVTLINDNAATGHRLQGGVYHINFYSIKHTSESTMPSLLVYQEQTTQLLSISRNQITNSNMRVPKKTTSLNRVRAYRARQSAKNKQQINAKRCQYDSLKKTMNHHKEDQRD